VVFGAGYLGRAMLDEAKRRGFAVAATSRSPERRAALEAAGIAAVDPADASALAAAVGKASAIVVTAPPEGHGCPGAKALLPALTASGAYPDWIGYVSSTAVYGDRNGGWVFEDDALNAASLEGARRVRAEADWFDAGRSVVDRLRDGSARIVRKPGQVFNRIYIDDAVEGLFASMERPRPGATYNLVDDAPSAVDVVMADAARRMGMPQPPEVNWTDPSVSEGMRRFYLDCKRISNARAKAELGWRPGHPTWREGLEAILASS
jgi:nucleoside-diphosphate-sugar epimerase